MAEEKTLPHSYNDGKEKEIFVCSEKFPFVGFWSYFKALSNVSTFTVLATHPLFDYIENNFLKTLSM